jgi:hypothetical protein
VPILTARLELLAQVEHLDKVLIETYDRFDIFVKRSRHSVIGLD